MHPMSPEASFLFSGTVGDAYVALCKLAQRALKAPCTLQRLSRHPGDALPAALARLFPGVTYVEPYVHFDTIEDMRVYAYAHAHRYTNIYFDGDGRGLEPDDPPGVELCPYPELALAPAVRDRSRPRVGIQLHSGSIPATCKRLELAWVTELAERLHAADVEVVLTGTGAGYDPAALAELPRRPGVTSLVGALDVPEWLAELAALDLLVSPEGCAVFFASSQRVPCLTFYDDAKALLRMAPPWRDRNVCMRLPDRPPAGFLRPIPAAAAASIVLAKIAPERA
jgi:ADP-heptose:LPS heptosyltransferase